MTDSTMKPRIVRLEREKGSAGLFYATSPDLKGLLVAAPTIEALDTEIPKAIKELYAACGIEVIVSLADDEMKTNKETWVAFPAAIARAALDCHP
jgi:hypothetical protein